MFVIFIIFFLVFAFYLFKKKTHPKEYSPNKIKKLGGNNIRNRFNKKKIPNDLDYIIIGSGMGGLTCAGLLSKVGKRVLVIEQHYIAGGCTHSFEDKGYEFDTGLHYVGHVNKINDVLDLITSPNIKWDQMGKKENGYCYDEINVAGTLFKFKTGEKEFLSEVLRVFPYEFDNVKRYLKDIRKTAKNDFYFISKVIRCKLLVKIINYFNSAFFKSINETALERISKYIKEPLLQSILLGQFGDAGIVPSKEPFFLQAGITDHYLDGGYYPRGGTSVLAKNIIPIIESTGGAVLVSKVKSIIIKNNIEWKMDIKFMQKLLLHVVFIALGKN